MEHNAVLIGGVGLVASVAAWLLCLLTGHTVAAWVAPLAISAFCLGLFVGAEYTTRGRFRVPYLSRHMHGLAGASDALERLIGVVIGGPSLNGLAGVWTTIEECSRHRTKIVQQKGKAPARAWEDLAPGQKQAGRGFLCEVLPGCH